MINWLEVFIGLFLGIFYSDVRDRILFFFRKRQFRQNLHDVLQFNLDRCIQMDRQITKEIDKEGFPDYLFDTDSMKSLMFNGREFFSSKEEFNSLNWQRYQLDHLNSKLGIIIDGNATGQYIQVFLNSLNREKRSIERLLGSWTKKPNNKGYIAAFPFT